MGREIGTGRKFWFPLRQRGAGLRGRRSLLIADRYGVYSFTYRRYIRKTRYHRYRALTAELAPVVKAYRSLQKLGMKKWPEHDHKARREIAHWKHKLMDVYWDAAPHERRASTAEHYLRVRYKHRMLYPFLAFDVPVLFGRVAQLVMLGSYTPTWDLLAYVLAIGSLVALTEKLVTSRWILTRSEIHDVLEFELTN
jgi:hypothetical protein